MKPAKRHKPTGERYLSGNPPPEFIRVAGCAKRAYRRRRDAVKAAKRSAALLRVYVCDRCGHHHLTSRVERAS